MPQRPETANGLTSGSLTAENAGTAGTLALWAGLGAAAVALGLFAPFTVCPWLALVVFAPLAWILDQENTTGIFRGMAAGWAFGTIAWAAGTIWLPRAMVLLLDIPPGRAWAWAALIWLYQGIAFGVLGGVCGWINQKGRRAGPLFCASLLTLLLFIRPTLFPVSSVAAVALWPEFIQIADIGGEFLVCFALLWVNWLVPDFIARLRQGVSRRNWAGLAVLPAVLCAVLGYGTVQISRVQAAAGSAGTITVASVQPNVPVHWEKKQLHGFATDEALCLQALAAGPDTVRGADLVVFPEMPRFNCRAREFEASGLGPALRELAVPVLMQSDETILAPDPPTVSTSANGLRTTVSRRIQARYSSVFAMAGAGGVSRVYQKVHLVPFAEAVPWPSGVLGHQQGLGLSAGDRPGLMTANGVKVQPLVCFETGFPGLVRQGTALGADLLAEVSDDAWFASPDAERKHLAMGIFRAVEFRRPLVRCSNSGTGAHIRATGQIVPGTLTPHHQAWVARAALSCPGGRTFFARWGNTWLWLLGAVAAAKIGWVFVRPGHGNKVAALGDRVGSGRG